MQKHQTNPRYIHGLITWGIIVILLGLSFSLAAYYTYVDFLRQVSLSFILSGFILLLLGMKHDLDEETHSSVVSFILLFFIVTVYFYFRSALHRFDFGVGDAADYYVAGVCSITYGQDIGFFLPLTASISALGYDLFGAAHAPFMHVLLYSVTIPVSYFLLRKLQFTPLLSLLMTFFLTLTPLSIWFSRTSFSEPIWQLTLLIFSLLAVLISEKENPELKLYVALILLLALQPFLRGEAALYYGLIIFLALYHFWKHKQRNTALLLLASLFVLALSIHYTLGIRAHYLLKWQFSRIIPDITEMILMSILYGVLLVSIILMYLLSKFHKSYIKLNLPMVITMMALLFKVTIAYLYAQKKDLSFTNFLFFNEYGLALGNFGLPLTIVIFVGLVLLHYKAFKGDILALIFVVIYAIFYLPFVMQGVTFHDPHEVFLYWNRYYLSIFMVIHFLGLSLVLKAIYDTLERWIKSTLHRTLALVVLLALLMFSSMNYKLHKIVTTEAYLENANHVFTWVKKRVKNKNITVLYDSDIKYRRHNGEYDAKVFVSRAFTVARIFAKKYQKIDPHQLETNVTFEEEMTKRKYVLCISSKPCKLKNQELKHVDETILPISWREHYMAHPKSEKDVHGDVTKSLKNYVDIHLTLYSVIKK